MTLCHSLLLSTVFRMHYTVCGAFIASVCITSLLRLNRRDLLKPEISTGQVRFVCGTSREIESGTDMY